MNDKTKNKKKNINMKKFKDHLNLSLRKQPIIMWFCRLKPQNSIKDLE